MAASGRHKDKGGGHIIGASLPRDKRKSLFVQGLGCSVEAGMPFAMHAGIGS